jgi:hypothetical protein
LVTTPINNTGTDKYFETQNQVPKVIISNIFLKVMIMTLIYPPTNCKWLKGDVRDSLKGENGVFAIVELK